MLCIFCGSSKVCMKKIEFRNINAITMKIISSESITELECGDCGWIGKPDSMPIPVGAF